MGDVLKEAYADALTRDCPNGCAKAGTACNDRQVCTARVGGEEE